MKAKTFENLLRRIVREEIDYALRREIKSLKEDLRDNVNKPLIKEQPINNNSIPEETKIPLKEKIMGKQSIEKQNFTNNSALNDLLNETAQGDTNTQTALAPTSNPFANEGVLPTETMPQEVQKVVNRDYRELMRAIDSKKNK